VDIENLKHLLKKHGVTQTSLAHLLGRDKAVITNLMQGRRALKAEEAVLIARHLGIDVAQLLGEKPARKGAAEPDALIPFRQPPSRARRSPDIVERNGRHYLRDAGAIRNDKAYALEVKDESLNLIGFLPGDIAVSELDLPCKAGQVAVVQHYRGASAETILRKYEPPFLMPHSTRADFRPLHEEHDTLRIVSPVVKLIRLL
jgi:transcriptional regulator with XRE-family HTH domain